MIVRETPFDTHSLEIHDAVFTATLSTVRFDLPGGPVTQGLVVVVLDWQPDVPVVEATRGKVRVLYR